jgi:hypothetical protein
MGQGNGSPVRTCNILEIAIALSYQILRYVLGVRRRNLSCCRRSPNSGRVAATYVQGPPKGGGAL